MDTTYQTQPQTEAENLHAISGIEGLRISVAHAESAAPDVGMSLRDLSHFTQGMLRLAGVPVLPDDADAPTLHTILAVRKVADLFSVTLSVELWDRVWLARQSHNHPLHASTWRRTSTLVSNRHELRDNTRMELGHLLTAFLNDYADANSPG